MMQPRAQFRGGRTPFGLATFLFDPIQSRTGEKGQGGLRTLPPVSSLSRGPGSARAIDIIPIKGVYGNKLPC